ncbi:FAD-dependent monooxygenase [Nonomuraea sp. NPDC046802]|uniref:FAD-dependent monooxygenase n=1 Tax=Nonomuraea sp. NPDC046802 TaxID=3154919 RepID=UPI0034090C96
MKTAAIVGGGIGGLTAALALHRRGWQVRVYERAPALEEVGAAIALAPNALRALRTLEIDLSDLAAIGGQGGIRRPDGTWLARTDIDAVAAGIGDTILLLARADLVKRLTDRLPSECLVLGATVAEVEQNTNAATLRITGEDGESGEEQATVVVAADGIWSRLRPLVAPHHSGPRYAGYTCWRFLTRAPRDGFTPAETFGTGTRFAIMPMTRGRVYCYATAIAPQGERAPDERAELHRRFATWHDPIAEVIDSVRPDEILRNDIWHIPGRLPAYHRGRIVLLGDAAHAMTPDLGQGGCQAIEDAITLAHHLAATGDAADLTRALRAYTVARRPRTHAMVRRSALTGRLVHLKAPAAVWARDRLLWAAERLPERWFARGIAPIHDWHPPAAG